MEKSQLRLKITNLREKIYNKQKFILDFLYTSTVDFDSPSIYNETKHIEVFESILDAYIDLYKNTNPIWL